MDGKLCRIRRTACWSFLDTDTGRPARVPEEIERLYVLEEKLDMNYASRKVPMPQNGETGEPFAVQKHHLDTNHHVNNGQYIQMAREYITADFAVRQMRAECKKSALPGDVVLSGDRAGGRKMESGPLR